MEVKFESKLSISDQEKDELLSILPDCFETLVTNYNPSTEGFYTEIRSNIRSREEALQWKTEFEEKSKTSYNADSTYEENTQKTLFKCVYHCLHNTRPKAGTKSPHYKHTKCQAKLIINVKQSTMKRSKDVYLKIFPCKISLRHEHNHSINSADALRHKKPSDEVKENFVELFSKGHLPSSALEYFKINLQYEHADDYFKIVADGSKCPTRKWCYQLYYSIFKKEYGDPTGPKMLEALKELMTKYNTKCGCICAAVSDEPDDLVIAVCSPLMQRVHKYIKASSEIMFVDSSGNMDRHNSRVFLLLCPSVVGALPLATILTYNESEKVISKGLALLKTILKDWAFYDNSGPAVIITDDSAAERQALATCFPNSTLLLCKFHVLQSIMRYLWDGKHGIHKNDKIYIYNLFHKVINIQQEESSLQEFLAFINNSIVQKYPNFINYIKHYEKRSQEWAMCYRTTMLTRGNDTNNYCEATFKILKDKILHRTKAFSIVQMFDYLTSSFERYYERKISDLINNRTEGITKSKYFVCDADIDGVECEIVDDNIYKVTSNNHEYFVNISIEMCTCFVGKTGAPCKHQYAVISKFKLTSQQFIPVNDPKEKILLAKLISDCSLPDNWFDNLTDSGVNKCTDDNNVVVDSAGVQVNDDAPQSPIEICSSPTVENALSEEQLTAAESNFKEAANIILDKFKQSPDIYLQPINKFSELVKEAKTDSAMISAVRLANIQACP